MELANDKIFLLKKDFIILKIIKKIIKVIAWFAEIKA